MPRVSSSVDIMAGDQIRVRPRLGGGFCLLIGEPGDHRVVLAFPDAETAETLAAVLTTSALTHGSLGAAIEATRPDNVVQLVRAANQSTDLPPDAA